VILVIAHNGDESPKEKLPGQPSRIIVLLSPKL